MHAWPFCPPSVLETIVSYVAYWVTIRIDATTDIGSSLDCKGSDCVLSIVVILSSGVQGILRY